MKDVKTSHHIYLGLTLFFLIITAQTLWSTIHGDGAVYAWMIREICQNPGSLLAHPLAWMREGFFIDHPYFFFYFSAPIAALFGTGDIGIKLPNYLVGFLSLWLVFKTVQKRNLAGGSSWPGLLAGYVLVANPLYELMLRQPTLDPLAQWLSLSAIFILLFGNFHWNWRFFGAGLMLGLAFLTKGLELLPNLAALFIMACLLLRQQRLSYVKYLTIGFVGLMIPILLWLSYDRIFWDQHWLSSYIDRQFKHRFFSAENAQSGLDLGYLKNLISKYFIQIGIIVWGSIKSFQRHRSLDLFWWFTVLYSVFNIIAFTLIKKDSSQHLTGIFLFTSILIGPYLYSLAPTTRTWKKMLAGLHYAIFVGVGMMWIWFMTQPNTKNDLWNNIKNQNTFFSQPQNQLPVVLDTSAPDLTGFYFTAQWYWPQVKLYLPAEAKQNLQTNQDVFLIRGIDDNSFTIQPEKFQSYH